MFPRQNDADADEHTNHETGDETETSRVTHRTFAEIENPRRLVLVHELSLNRASVCCNHCWFAVFLPLNACHISQLCAPVIQ